MSIPKPETPTLRGKGGWPVQGTVTSEFGYRTHPITGKRAMHTGIDIGAKTGTDIHAAGDGVVIFSGKKGGYGNIVEIRHANGVETRYAHNSANLVKVGDLVQKGQVIGKVGSTGRSTGPHLHFEVRKNGQAVNPRTMLGQNLSMPSDTGVPDKEIGREDFSTLMSMLGMEQSAIASMEQAVGSLAGIAALLTFFAWMAKEGGADIPGFNALQEESQHFWPLVGDRPSQGESPLTDGAAELAAQEAKTAPPKGQTTAAFRSAAEGHGRQVAAAEVQTKPQITFGRPVVYS